ncbi:MFS transporter [Bifidobacterium jacchi]|uniref:MFS transporter n=1 Tax=Bifidobacterium jacchi TaxID=2490545 RepID=A0A5N5RED8_9BIFI|nr:MFS transporter [Bifidobacterium jacchi]KAB5604847.1 MFS transporter [Bifidobacterium jacchi]
MSDESQSRGQALGRAAMFPVMASFLVLSFIDFVGTATNYVKPEYDLSNTVANLFTTMACFWFLIFSAPTSVLMSKIGRRKTVLVSILVTLFAMAFPIVGYAFFDTDKNPVRFVLLVISFVLLGVGNTLMQVSLNPLLGMFAHGDKLAATLNIGQGIKACTSLLTPLIVSWFAIAFGKWWLVYVLYLVIGVVIYVLLSADKIDEPEVNPDTKTTIGGCLSLLKDPVVLLCFFGIIMHMTIDVSVNAQGPRILAEMTGWTPAAAASFNTIYYASRAVSSLGGVYVLSRISNKAGLRISTLLLVLSMVLMGAYSLWGTGMSPFVYYVAMCLCGLGNSNMFTLYMERAMLVHPDRKNEISALMIMGLFGGAVFPPIVGAAADGFGQIGGVAVMFIVVLFAVYCSFNYKVLLSKEERASLK